MRTGIVGRETLKAKHKPRVYKNIPEGWLTIAEVAERLDVSISAVSQLRRRGHLEGKHFTGEWDATHRPWFFHESTVEECRASEHYKKTRQRGKNGMLIAIGKGVPDKPADAPTQKAERNLQHNELSFGYTHDEIIPDWDNSPFDIAKNYTYE